ncbi:hypothetical protein ACIQOW_38905 [Kitasatospora sp. NPDC091335]|uniref:hypothetical protein n=1 Tax=Kitasatospora sp. NPDC091335 TaxID=3364085 RepID=UPI0037FDDFFA
MTDPSTRPPLRPLPVRVPPRLGEGTDSYLRRLARANHLKPSYLNALTSPRSNIGKPDITLLAQLAGRRPADLRRALSDAPGRPQPEQHKPADLREAGQSELIRGIDLLLALAPPRNGVPWRLAARRHGLRRKDLRRALQQQPVRRLARAVPADDTQRRRIRALAGAGRSTAQIWARMMDDHDTPLTYSAINAFLQRVRRM